MAFLERFNRRRPLDQIVGFAGGTLGDQIDRQPRPQEPTRFLQSPQPTMADRYMQKAEPITMAEQYASQAQPVDQPAGDARPRTVNPFLDRLLSHPELQERERRTQPRDVIADDAQDLADLRNKPLGVRGKLGLVAQNIATNLGGRPLQTRRQRDIEKATGQLSQDLAVQKAQIERDTSQMVPFQLPDGSVTYVPAKTAGSLAVRQQGQQSTLSERKRMNDAHVKRWDTMGKHEAAQDAQRLYNSGAADDDDDLKDEVVRRMGLPVGTKLPNSTQGQVSVDASGNFILVNRRTGQAAPVMQPAAEGQPPARVGSFQKTTEAGRERRFNAGETGRNVRAANREAGVSARAANRGGNVDRATARQAAKLAGQIDQIRKELESFDSRQRGDVPLSPSRKAARDEIVNRGAGIASELANLDAGYEAASGTGGYPYYKKGAGSDLDRPIYGTPTSSKGSFNLGAWKADHPNATQEQINAQRQKAKARNLAIVE